MRPRARTGARLQPTHDGLLAESEQQPEAQLVIAIIERAIEDAREGDQDAYRFLTDESGKWSTSRADLCWCIGVDPDDLRRNVLTTIKAPKADAISKAKVSTFVPKKLPPMRDQILDALAATGKPMHVKEVARLIERDCGSTGSILWNLLKDGRVEKVAPATFQIKTSFSQAA